jgi:hypothetical protein
MRERSEIWLSQRKMSQNRESNSGLHSSGELPRLWLRSSQQIFARFSSAARIGAQEEVTSTAYSQ